MLYNTKEYDCYHILIPISKIILNQEISIKQKIMETTTEYLDLAHTNDMQWKSAITFYKDEIAVMRKLLEEVNQKNTSKDLKFLISHFENQFIINSEVIDELNHEINLREDYIARRLKANPSGYEFRVVRQYAELKGKVYVFEKMFAELKIAFNKFLATIM